MEIADKIKNARIKKAYTQEQVAEKLLVSRQTISNWENGKSLPDIISIIKISELYELSLDELIKGNNLLLGKIEKDITTTKIERNLIKFAVFAIALGIIMLLLSHIFSKNPIIAFINGALPWILFSLMFLVAILLLKKDE